MKQYGERNIAKKWLLPTYRDYNKQLTEAEGEPDTPDVSVARRSKSTLNHVDGNLRVERDAIVYAQDKLVTVDGRVETEGPVIFEGGLKARELHAKDGDLDIRGDLNVKERIAISDGSLHVSGSLSATDVDVDRHLEVLGSLTAVRLEAGSRIAIHGKVKARRIEVGGSLEASQTLEADEIDAGGSVRITGQVNAKSIDVGGSVTIGGGKITDDIEVGGTFESTGSLEFNEIDVGGSVRLKGNSGGKRIDVGGILDVSGDLKFEEIDVGGTIEIEGNGEGSDIDVGGVLKVGGNLTLVGDLEVGGRCRIDGTLTADRVEIGGTLEAKSVKVKEFKVGGSASTENGVRATSIVVCDRGRIKGPVFADSIRLGERSDAEAVYGKVIMLEERCRCSSLQGVDLRIQSGCKVLGEVLYSGSLEAEKDVLFAVAPKKVDRLPAQPIEA